MTTPAVCPHCALLCDDLKISEQSDLSFKVDRQGCARARSAYAHPPTPVQAYSKGEPVSLDKAVADAALILKRARNPLIAGLATDVEGMRASVGLAERCNGIVDHVHGDSLASMSKILQSRGWYATTLSEVRNRADLVVLVDADLGDRFPKFQQRCLTRRVAMNGNAARKVAFLGGRNRIPEDWNPDYHVNCTRQRLAETLRDLQVHVNNDTARGSKALRNLAAEILNADYVVFAFTPATLGSARESVIGAIGDLVDLLNQTARAAILPLGGDDGAQSAASVCAWLTGYPLRVGFGQNLVYEPRAFATDHLLSTGAVDALVWIDAYGNHSAPPTAAARESTIVLSCRPPRNRQRTGIHIPVGTPGIDHGARLIRSDGVVTLALPQQRDSGLHSVAGIVARIRDRI